ncbi:MAG TPA: RidA family protein [Gaiella sp.]|jgi:2-iminobutanoate/2-iminopropanoate deaminase|nr:RidA family protein [Gaiella sp.]
MTERVVVGELPVGGQEPLISSAVRWGDLLFLSGRAPIDTTTMEVVSSDFAEQAQNVLDQILTTLAEAGSGPEHVLRVQCYLLHAEDFGEWNRLWAETFASPRPVRTTIVTGFTVPGMLIEVEVTAGIPS